MNIAIIILAVFLVALLVLSFIPIRLEVSYEKDEVGNTKSVTVKYGFIKYSILPEKPSKKAKKTDKKDEPEEKKDFSFEEKKAELEKYIRIFDTVKGDAVKLLSYAARRAAVFDKIELKSEFGFDDAMNTGIFTGIYNGFVYSILGVIHNTSTLKAIDVKLQPIFGKKCFNFRIFCILHMKTVHIMIIAFSVLRIFKRIKKEGRK